MQELLGNAGTGARLLLTTDYGPKAVYGVAAVLGAYYGIRGGIGLTYRCASGPVPTPLHCSLQHCYQTPQQRRHARMERANIFDVVHASVSALQFENP